MTIPKLAATADPTDYDSSARPPLREILFPDDLKRILADHAAWLCDKHQGRRANLASTNLRREGFYGADLSRANLRGADLRDATLSNTDLSFADLRGADLRGADLVKADLTGARLDEADLRGADLYRADLSHAELAATQLHGARLTSAFLEEVADLPPAVAAAVRLLAAIR